MNGGGGGEEHGANWGVRTEEERTEDGFHLITLEGFIRLCESVADIQFNLHSNGGMAGDTTRTLALLWLLAGWLWVVAQGGGGRIGGGGGVIIR